jgi:histidine triad (HIT) family protein
VLGHLQTVATKLARERNLTEGFRTVINTGRNAGQSVLHLHLHLLGGRIMRWPPG